MLWPALFATLLSFAPVPVHTVPLSWEGVNQGILVEVGRRQALWKAAQPPPPPVWHPTPAPRPRAPQPAIQGHACAYAALIRDSFGGAGEWATGIAWRESRCTTTSASPTGCLGLFQICWPLHADIEQSACGRSDRDGMFDPKCNVAIAARMYAGSGTRPWS